MNEEIKELLEKNEYNFYDLVKIMKVLRSENGCPWDKEQDHKSIRKNFIEEVYEAVEAIDTDNAVLLREELGDVMLQVVFHARISEEAEEFGINDVTNDICKKLIVRHPHIFGNVVADTSEKVLENWDAIKMKTKGQKTAGETLRSVSVALPSLMRSEKIIHKAKKFSINTPSSENIAELLPLLECGDEKSKKDALGKIFFSLCAYADSEGIDADEALYKTTEDFIEKVEEQNA